MFKSITEVQLLKDFDAVMAEVDTQKTTFIVSLTAGGYVMLVPVHEYKTSEKMVDVPIELPDADMLALSMAAHKADMTLNDYCNQVLRDYIDGKVKLAIPKNNGMRKASDPNATHLYANKYNFGDKVKVLCGKKSNDELRVYYDINLVSCMDCLALHKKHTTPKKTTVKKKIIK